MAVKQRRSSEAGHRRKFLVVIDETPECARALYYAARRAEHTGGGVVLLYVIEPSDFQHWLGVENIMRAEAMEAAENTLGRFADTVREYSHIEPQLVIREGASRAEEIMKLIEEDEDIAVLVLAAAVDKEGPGPLVTAIAGKASGTFPVPITIVPGNLDDLAMAAIT
jgi:nucleotide-binding universal stress UspA family protein